MSKISKRGQGQHSVYSVGEIILIVFYIHTAIYIYRYAVLTVGCTFQLVEECAEGTYSPYCSGYSRGLGRLHIMLHSRV